MDPQAVVLSQASRLSERGRRSLGAPGLRAAGTPVEGASRRPGHPGPRMGAPPEPDPFPVPRSPPRFARLAAERAPEGLGPTGNTEA